MGDNQHTPAQPNMLQTKPPPKGAWALHACTVGDAFFTHFSAAHGVQQAPLDFVLRPVGQGEEVAGCTGVGGGLCRRPPLWRGAPHIGTPAHRTRAVAARESSLQCGTLEDTCCHPNGPHHAHIQGHHHGTTRSTTRQDVMGWVGPLTAASAPLLARSLLPSSSFCTCHTSHTTSWALAHTASVQSAARAPHHITPP